MIFNTETKQGTNALAFDVKAAELPALQTYSSVIPSFGPDLGGTVVVVHGEGFQPDLSSCRFGNMVAAGSHVISSSEIECVTPPSQTGCVTLNIVREDKETFDVFGKHFCFQALPAVTSIEPSHGVWKRDQIVTVSGTGFHDHSYLVCQVGESSLSSALWISSSQVLCSMTATTIGHLVVEVSNNGKDFSSDGITFEAHKMLRIDKVVRDGGLNRFVSCPLIRAELCTWPAHPRQLSAIATLTRYCRRTRHHF